MNLIELQEWQALQRHYHEIKQLQMADLFLDDEQRCKQFSLQLGDLFFDYSKNRITADTVKLLCNLAAAVELPNKIMTLFTGENINSTEQRPALHTALRSPADFSLVVNNENIVPKIHHVLEKMAKFCEQVISQQWRGFSNEPITDIVNIGIGGSHLGPLMVKEALTQFSSSRLNIHFVSNVHQANIASVLASLKPANTLFIISSKSFTTLEMLLNAKLAKQWLLAAFGEDASLDQHLVAVTANKTAAMDYGILEAHIFEFWEWVGGRFSVWSAIGLPVALAIGMKNFKDFLAGAHAMDQHFKTAPLAQNIPIIMGLLGIWYNNFFNTKTHAVIPYNYYLRHFSAYLQQLDMESNGKSVDKQGAQINYATGPIVWGEIGTDGQHAFHQLLHQGTQLVAADFIIAIKDVASSRQNQDVLFASCLSQSRALMLGKSLAAVAAESISNNKAMQANTLAPHKVLTGNRPSNTLVLKELNPFNLGMLLALYEHKVIVQGLIWNINSFDQWGVELGKQMANEIIEDLAFDDAANVFDGSTNQLLTFYKQMRS